MRFQDNVANLSRRVLNRMGHEAVYYSSDGQKNVSAFLDMNVAEIGEYGTFVGSRIEIELLKEDVDPVRGDVIEINGHEYTVEGIVVADNTNNAMVRIVVRE